MNPKSSEFFTFIDILAKSSKVRESLDLLFQEALHVRVTNIHVKSKGHGVNLNEKENFEFMEKVKDFNDKILKELSEPDANLLNPLIKKIMNHALGE